MTLHLTLDQEEALRLLSLPCEPMTAEELAELEEVLSEFHGRPVQLPRDDVS